MKNNKLRIKISKECHISHFLTQSQARMWVSRFSSYILLHRTQSTLRAIWRAEFEKRLLTKRIFRVVSTTLVLIKILQALAPIIVFIQLTAFVSIKTRFTQASRIILELYSPATVLRAHRIALRFALTVDTSWVSWQRTAIFWIRWVGLLGAFTL